MTTKTKPRVWTVPAVVRSVADGDSFHVDLDLGWKVSTRAMVRIEGVNAPELPTRYGKAAKQFLQELLPAGSIVTIESKRLDKYGRTQARVTLSDGRDLAGVCLSSTLFVRMDGY